MTKWFILPVIPLDKYVWRYIIHKAFERYTIKVTEKELKEAFKSKGDCK